jgi:excisionase family DNA binding protein
MNKTFLKTDEVAQRLGVCEHTVRRLAESGVLPAYKIGAQLRFKSEDVENYFNAARVGGKDGR